MFSDGKLNVKTCITKTYEFVEASIRFRPEELCDTSNFLISPYKEDCLSDRIASFMSPSVSSNAFPEEEDYQYIVNTIDKLIGKANARKFPLGNERLDEKCNELEKEIVSLLKYSLNNETSSNKHIVDQDTNPLAPIPLGTPSKSQDLKWL